MKMFKNCQRTVKEKNECWQKLLDFEHFSLTPLDFFNIFFMLVL